VQVSNLEKWLPNFIRNLLKAAESAAFLCPTLLYNSYVKYQIKNLEEFKSLIQSQAISADNSSSLPLVFLLSGDLGAGKTEAARQISQVFHVKHLVRSPTFIYTYEHEAVRKGVDCRLSHWDLWRLDKQNFELSGFKDSLRNSQIIIVEWWERFVDEVNLLLDPQFFFAVKITIHPGQDEQSRVVVID